MKKVVLLSGGLDSAVCLASAVWKNGKENVTALSIYYGQKHEAELKCAANIARYYGVKHYIVDASEVFKHSDCSLLQHSDKKIVHKSYAEQLSEKAGTVSTYVPFRNGLFLSCAASLAMSIYPGEIVQVVYGAHADDAAGRAYPDCTPEFAKSMNSAISEGSGGLCYLSAPLLFLNKSEVVTLGNTLNVPFEMTRSCYEAGDKHCGTCATCLDRKKAFLNANVPDPTEYEV